MIRILGTTYIIHLCSNEGKECHQSLRRSMCWVSMESRLWNEKEKSKSDSKALIVAMTLDHQVKLFWVLVWTDAMLLETNMEHIRLRSRYQNNGIHTPYHSLYRSNTSMHIIWPLYLGKWVFTESNKEKRNLMGRWGKAENIWLEVCMLSSKQKFKFPSCFCTTFYRIQLALIPTIWGQLPRNCWHLTKEKPIVKPNTANTKHEEKQRMKWQNLDKPTRYLQLLIQTQCISSVFKAYKLQYTNYY